jgi:hypothetical protein
MSLVRYDEMRPLVSGDFSAAAIFVRAVKPAPPWSSSLGTTAARPSPVRERYSAIRSATASGVSG